jgi:hypothetical protein
MKLQLSEVWDFIALMQDHQADWVIDLHAGDVTFESLTFEEVLVLKTDETYDQELLPSIFIYREILWQPNVYGQPNLCLPGLKLLQAYCQEFIEQNNSEQPTTKLYHSLLSYLSGIADEACKEIQEQPNAGIAKVLGNFRKKAFPIIKFFIWHPSNKSEHTADAHKRLNYAVKILLTQYFNQYSELASPYWQVRKLDEVDDHPLKFISESEDEIVTKPSSN